MVVLGMADHITRAGKESVRSEVGSRERAVSFDRIIEQERNNAHGSMNN